MKCGGFVKFFAFAFIFLFLCVSVLAESNPQPSPSPSQQAYNNSVQGNNLSHKFNQSQQIQGFDFGLPNLSSADPEYVAKQKMVEGMTNAYTWVSMNSARFSDGCKNDKASLVRELSNIIQQAQEASTACKRFELEASNCDPELFCNGVSKGKLPIPPEAKSALKKLGYNPDTLKIEDITPELISKVCLEQTGSDLSKRKQMVDAAKKQVLSQLANLRKNCESMQNNMVPDIHLPDFKPFQNGPNLSNQQGQNPQAVCPGASPNCGGSSKPYCENGRWVCTSSTNLGTYSNGQPMGPYCPAPAPNCNGGDSPSCNPGGWSCPQGMATQQQDNYQQSRQQQGCVDSGVVCGTGMQPVCVNGRKECIQSQSQQAQQNFCPGRPYSCGNGVMAYCQDGRWTCPPMQSQPQGTCQGTAPPCNNSSPVCQNGSWVCQSFQQPQQPSVCQGNPYDCGNGVTSFCQDGRWTCPSTQNQPTPQNNPQQNSTVQNTSPPSSGGSVSSSSDSSTPVPGPGAAYPPSSGSGSSTPSSSGSSSSSAPASSGGGSAPAPGPGAAYPPTASSAPAPAQGSGVQAMVDNVVQSFITGLFTESAGSTATSAVSESNPQPSPNPQMYSSSASTQFNPQGNNQQGQNYAPQNYNPQGYNSQNKNYNPQGPNNQQNNYGSAIGPSPETLCKMTDEEVLEIYVGSMEGSISNDEQMNQYRCKQEAIKIIDEMGRYKLEIARCKADAALDCEAKTQALSTCNQLKNEPEKIASMIADNMCRRFVAPDETKSSKLLNVAEKFTEVDPALANQLGDTAEQTISDKKKLDIASYLLGNGDYGAKLKERAAKLKEIRDRLQSKNAGDSETIAALDEQVKDLEDEGNKFSNTFDIARLGYLFRQ
jgi:hypothetical protein